MAEQVSIERPAAQQFPPKYVQLPSIASPQPNIDNQMVPYGGVSGGKAPVPGLRGSDGFDSDDKVRQLETRLTVAEKSNRALLEEVVRLQTELKSTMRRNEDILREERNARQQLEMSLRTSNDLIAQMNARIKNMEEKVQEERQALTSLVSHTKNVEQAVLGSQQELVSKKDSHGSQLQELKANLEEVVTAKARMERMSYSLMDDLRQLKARVETQNSDFHTATSELKQRARKLEDEHRLSVDAYRKQEDTKSSTEQNTSHLRGQIENRLAELRDVIMDLRTKQDTEIQERRALEQQVQGRLNEMNASVVEQNRKREESLHALDVVHREKEHAAGSERLKLQGRMAEMVEEVSRNVLNKEMRLREEGQERNIQIEKTVNQEMEARNTFEKALREENDKRWTAIKKLEDEEIQTLREALKVDRTKTRDTLQKLDQSISLLEKQVLETKKGSEKVMTAEIKSRKHHEKSTQQKLDDVQEKLQVATSTLQQAIGGIKAQVTSHDDQLRREMKTMLEDAEQARTRALADLDARLTALKQKMSTNEDVVEAKIAAGLASQSNPEATAVMSQNIREKVQSISLWQDVTNGTIQELNRTMQKLPEDVYMLEERYKLMKSETNNRLDVEAESRLRDVQTLQLQIDEVKSSKRRDSNAPSKADLVTCQQSIRKLAESIQTVKTVLGMKIQSEQKLRVEEVNDLHFQMIRLKAVVEPLLSVQPQPRLFVKNPEVTERKRAEKHAPSINKWSIYTAYRWLDWKTRWCYIKWKKAAMEAQSIVNSKPSSALKPPFPSRDPTPVTSNSPENKPNSARSDKPSRTSPAKNSLSKPNSRHNSPDKRTESPTKPSSRASLRSTNKGDKPAPNLEDQGGDNPEW